MPADAYLSLLAATNMKQRVRKLLEYTWADRLGYAVIGTPNLLEYDQGFFVKGGDGLADVKPIAGLYKGQVYALARELGLPEAIATRAPTTETFWLPQTQEEFYFGYPYERMDVLMWGQAQGVAPADLATAVGLTPRRSSVAYAEIERRRTRPRTSTRPPSVLDRRLTCAGSRASSAPIRRGGRRAGAAADGAGDSPSRAGRLRARPRSRRRPRLDRLSIVDIPRRLAADAERRRRQRPRLQRRGLQPRRAAASSRPAGVASRPGATPRSSSRCSSARASPALERLNGQFAFAWWQPADAAADAGPRPLRRPAAATSCRDDGSIVFGSEAKALFASGEVARRPDLAGIDEVFTLWGAAAAANRVRRRPPGPARRGARLGARRDRRGAALVDAPSPSSRDAGEGDLERDASRQRPAAAARRRSGRRLPLRAASTRA